MGSGWEHVSPLPDPYPYYEIGENPNPYPNPVKSGKIRQIGVGLGGYPWTQVLLSCLYPWVELSKWLVPTGPACKSPKDVGLAHKNVVPFKTGPF